MTATITPALQARFDEILDAEQAVIDARWTADHGSPDGIMAQRRAASAACTAQASLYLLVNDLTPEEGHLFGQYRLRSIRGQASLQREQAARSMEQAGTYDEHVRRLDRLPAVPDSQLATLRAMLVGASV